MAIIIDGKKIAQEIRDEIKAAAIRLKEEKGIIPGLAVILVGDDPASQVYVRGKKKACDEVGFMSREYRLPAETEETGLLKLIAALNQDKEIHGILVQLPLPRHIDPATIIEAISPAKDVDGFHPVNIGYLFTGKPCPMACTPRGVVELLDRTGIKIEGKETVIVGRSNLVGKPLSIMMLARNATVTVCHSKTANLAKVSGRADILVAAVGRPEMISADMIKDGAVVIDVGVNRLADGRLVGDVCYREAAEKAAYITPVPGGVGPMTIAMLMKSTLEASQRNS